MSETAAPAPDLRDFSKYARSCPTRHLVYSACLEVAYWLLLPLFVYVAFTAYVDGGLMALLSIWFFVLLSLVELTGRLRRRFRVDAAKALTRASGAPVLYLRSFYYESADGRPAAATSLDRKKEARRERENDDEVLALALRGLGPLVAVGKPGTRIPPLGAIRLFFKDSEWQAHVKRLIGLARLVIVQPGYSDGTEWEMRTLRDMGLPPEKIIFSFLSWQHLSRASRRVEYEMFAMQFKRIYGFDPPPKLGSAYFLYFDRDWQPRLAGIPLWQRPFFWLCSRPSIVWTLLSRFPTDSPYWLFRVSFLTFTYLLDYLPTPRLFRRFRVPGVREALRPVLRRRGLRLPVWRTAGFVAAVALVAAVMWRAPSLYEGTPGHYRVAAYDGNEEVIFSGDLWVDAPPFDGTYELRFESRGAVPPFCYATPRAGGESVRGTLRGEQEAEAPSGRLSLTFEGLGQAQVYKFGRVFDGWWFSLRPKPRRVDIGSLTGEEKVRAAMEAMRAWPYGASAATEELRVAALCGGKRIEVERLLW